MFRVVTPDETTSEEKSSRSYWGFVLWPVAVIVLYVLSAGPVYFAYEKCWVRVEVLRVYNPLWAVVGKTCLMKPMRIYLHFWTPHIFDVHGEVIGHLHD